MFNWFTSFIGRTVFVSAVLCGPLGAQWTTGFYESQNGVQPVSAIPWTKYTHIVHFAAEPDGAGGLSLRGLSQAETRQLIAGRPAGKKVLLSIRDNSHNLNAFAASTAPGMLKVFVGNIAAFALGNGYDGVDIDWERNVDSGRYGQLLALLRAALPAAVIAADWNNGPAEIAAAAASVPYVDQFNIMCYDMDAPGNGFSWHNDALFQSGNSHVMTCDWRVDPFLKAGVPAGKIGIGLPFYGRRWYGVTQALVPGFFQASTVFYSQLVTDVSCWQPQYQSYDAKYKSNYLSIPSRNEFISYTGIQEIQDVAAWIQAKGFGGAMTYSLHYEYLPGLRGDARYPLSTALYDALSGRARQEKPSPAKPTALARPSRRNGNRRTLPPASGALVCAVAICLAGVARERRPARPESETTGRGHRG